MCLCLTNKTEVKGYISFTSTEIKKLEKQYSSLQKRLLSEMLLNDAVTHQILLLSLTILPIELQPSIKDL